MPEGFNYLSQDLQELIELDVKAKKSISEVEDIINSKNTDLFMQKDESFEEFKRLNEKLSYIVELNEDSLYHHFLPVLCLPSSTSTFEGFSQDHRDSLGRLRHRAVVHML